MGHHFKTKDNSGHGSSCSELNIAKAQSNYCVLEQLMKVSCFLLSYKLGQEFNQDCSNNQDYITLCCCTSSIQHHGSGQDVDMSFLYHNYQGSIYESH